LIEIVIADDHHILTSGLEMLINAQNNMKVIGTATSGEQAYEMTGRLHPDVLLLDVNMPPGESGVVTAGKIHEDFPDTRILILTSQREREYLLYAIQVGAAGYVLKNVSVEELMEAIRTVSDGGVYVCKEMVPFLVQGFVNRHSVGSDSFLRLSSREAQILTLIARGYGNKEIGELLYISVKTVESYKSKIMNKLGLKTRAELVEYALKKRLIQY
jgi:two-component system response regulator NreC